MSRISLVSELRFKDHPNQPTAYEYASVKFPNGWGVSICKRKNNVSFFPPYNYVGVGLGGRGVYNRNVKYEVMRFNPVNERFDNEILTTDTQLMRIMTQVANIGKKPKRASKKSVR